MRTLKTLTVCVSASLLFASFIGDKAYGQNEKSGYPYQGVPFTSVTLSSGSFWGDRLKAAREVTIPLAFSKCESEGRYRNFTQCLNPSPDYPPSGFPFDDTDVYKTIEGASYILQTYPDKKLEHYIDSVLDIVGAAQESDGYLYTPRTMNPWHPHPWSGMHRWEQVEVLSHELYNLGHMVDAACAHYQATGSTKFLDIAKRYADCVIREIGPGENQFHKVPGHQIAEMALARLYVLTGQKEYLKEAEYFLSLRGKTSIHDIYTQSDKPILEQKEAWGHAVRAGYQYAGIADVAALSGDSAYVKAIDTIWENIVGRKYYITGGVGARHEGEAFGADYELPNMTAYNETCAAIAQVYLNQRMFLLHGEAKYIDCLERTLYNGVISGMSVDGGKFFYPNPLSSDGKYKFNADGTTTRQPWFGCACCPSNLCRFIPSVPGYVYAVRGNDVYVNLFADGKAEMETSSGKVSLSQKTSYPWNGDITITVDAPLDGEMTLKVRIPGWARGEVAPGGLYSFCDSAKGGWSVSVNGTPVDASSLGSDGYLPIRRVFKEGDKVEVHFDMPVRLVTADEKVEADRGRVAVERGPLVYCAEWADNPNVNVHEVSLGKPLFKEIPGMAITNTEGDGKAFHVMGISATAANGEHLTLIPYYAWCHRGAGDMEVWLRK